MTNNKKKPEQKVIEKLITQFPINWGSAQINRLAIRLISRYFLKFNLRFLDALIAATVLQSNFILIIDNTKHFKFISKLKIVSP